MAFLFGSYSVVALRRETVEPCKSCGDQVRLRLMYSAPHLSEDSDFYPDKNEGN